MLICPTFDIYAQSKKVKEAEKKKEQIQEKQKADEERQRKEFLENHYKKQSPATRKRMKENRKTDGIIYKNKDRRSFCEKVKSLFRKKKYKP